MAVKILFYESIGQYGMLGYFGNKLREAFTDLGVKTDQINIQHEASPEQIRAKNNWADLTIGFNEAHCKLNNHPHYDLFQKRHLAIFVDHPAFYTNVMNLNSPYLFVSCVDSLHCQFLQKAGFKNTFSLLHAADKNIPVSTKDRDLTLVMLGTLGDCHEMRQGWKRKYNSDDVLSILDCATETALYNRNLSVDFVLDISLQYLGANKKREDDPKLYDAMVCDIDGFTRAYHRLQTLRSIQNFTVHIYGNGAWKKYFRNQDNIKIHNEVSAQESLKIMQRSQIVLNIVPMFKYGAHERIFNAMACGSLVFTNDTLFMQEHFNDGQDAVLYNFTDLTTLNEKLAFYLEHPEKNREIAERGKELVFKEHTWHNRAQRILETFFHKSASV